MKKFKFKLASVLRLRSHEKDMAVQQLADSLRMFNSIKQQLQLLDTEINRARLQELPLHLGAQRDLFIQSLHVKSHRLQGELRSSEVLVNEARVLVAHAQAALRAVEKLKERQYNDWQMEFQRQEDRELAEVASRRSR
jgi:flagellar FliJ protein